jgi:hypothetical protein
MIGVLCENCMVGLYSKKLHKLMSFDHRYKDTDSYIVFSDSDLNVNNKSVAGKLVTHGAIKPLSTPTPNIIFNFSDPRKGKRTPIRTLAKQSEITLINEVNRFEQDMIREMLLSSDRTLGFVPSQSVPTENSAEMIFTLRLLRDAKNQWNVLPLSASLMQAKPDDEFVQLLYRSAREIARCIGNYLPLLAFCTVKLALNGNQRPFLNNFSGWDSTLLLKKQNPDLLKQLAINLYGYSHFLLNSKSEHSYVD